MYDKDKDLKEGLKKILNEVKEKRDKAPIGSNEKQYYRSISKNIDKTLRSIK